MPKREEYNKKAARIVAELERRKAITNIAETFCFPLQIEAIRDPSRRKVFFMPRRSGKSTMIGIYMLELALKHPGQKFLYIGRTVESCKNIMLDKIFLKALKRLGIVKPKGTSKEANYFNHHTSTIKLPNGSNIIFAGIESAPTRVDSLIGADYFMVCIDEAQLIRQDLDHIIEELEPGLADHYEEGGGILILSGYPGTTMGTHLFWRITKQIENGMAALDRENPWSESNPNGWKMFRWAPMDNPHMAKNYETVVLEHKEKYGDKYMTVPSFRRQWLGHWVLDESDLLYRYTDSNLLAHDVTHNDYNRDANIKKSLLQPSSNWTYMAGVDIGWEDATAIVVGAYSRTDKRFYIVESEKFNHTLPDAIGARLVSLKGKYNLTRIVMDTGGSGKITTEDLRARFALPVVPAEKPELESSIALMNNDFIAGTIKIIYEKNKDLIDEYAGCVVDQKKKQEGIWTPYKKNVDHLADAARYCFRESQHHHAVIPDAPHERDTADEMLEWRDRMKGFNRNAFGDEPDIFERIEEEQEARAIVEAYRGKR